MSLPVPPEPLKAKVALCFAARILALTIFVFGRATVTAGVAPAFESFRMAAGGIRPSFSRSRLLRGIATAEIALAVVLAARIGVTRNTTAGSAWVSDAHDLHD